MFFKTAFALLSVVTVAVHCLPVGENQQLTAASNGRFVLVTPVSQFQFPPVYRLYPQFYQPSTIARIDGLKQDEGGDNNWVNVIQNWWGQQTGGGSEEGADTGGDSSDAASGSKTKDKTQPQPPAESNDKQKFQAEGQKYFFTTPASTYALDPTKRYYVFADQPTQYYSTFGGFPSVPFTPGFNFQPIPTLVGRSSDKKDILSTDVQANPKTDAIAAIITDPLNPLKTMAIASAPAGLSPELQGRLSTVELSTVVSSQVQNNVPLVISEARSQVTAVPSERSSSEGNDENGDDSEEKRRKEPSIAQAKPTAIAVAGPGGVASSSPRATAVAASSGGLAVASPTATAVSGDIFGSGSDTNVDITDSIDDDKKQ